VGHARAADAATRHAGEAAKYGKAFASGLATDVPNTLATVLGLANIDNARRKLAGRNDPQIEQAMVNIRTLAQGASAAFEEMRRLGYGY